MAKDPITGLSPKEEDFCQQYVILKIGKSAYKIAYPKANDSTAEVESCKFLRKPKIIKRIKQIRAKIAEKLDLTNEDIALDFVELRESSKNAQDRANWNRANENLAKHIGFYERDNEQKRPQTNITLS